MTLVIQPYGAEAARSGSAELSGPLDNIFNTVGNVFDKGKQAHEIIDEAFNGQKASTTTAPPVAVTSSKTPSWLPVALGAGLVVGLIVVGSKLVSKK